MAAAARTAASRQTAVRRDPTPQHVDAESPLMQVINKLDDYVYALPNLAGSGTTGLPFYKATGWEVVLTPGPGEHGEDFFLGHTSEPGKPLEQMGHVLVRMPKAKHAQLEARGYDGGSGQALADVVEKRIISKRNFLDSMRGIGPGITAQNRTRGEMSIAKDEAEGDITLE